LHWAIEKASVGLNPTEAMFADHDDDGFVGDLRDCFLKSESQTEKLLPQPQLPVAFGLSNLKPRLSMPSR